MDTNLRRQSLSPVEEGRGYVLLVNEFGYAEAILGGTVEADLRHIS